MLTPTHHQYLERNTGLVRSERPFGDWIVNYLYCKKREQPPLIYQLLGSQWFSSLLGWVNYDFPMVATGAYPEKTNIPANTFHDTQKRH